MSAQTDLPPYDPQRMLSAPFPERVRLVCRSWAAISSASGFSFMSSSRWGL